MSLPYFKEFGWDAEVVVVDEAYSEIVRDRLLLQSIPSDIKIHKVKALNKSWTSKFGLGSLALRSMWYYRKRVNLLLKTQKFDLIYFSTTQFPLCILGAYWKKRFGVPYIIDMQDPWHSNYYKDKPKQQQPPKYWFSYRLNKYLEPIAMKSVDGLISVSENYITILKNRYPHIKNIPHATITFGAYSPDLKIAADNRESFPPLLNPAFKNIVYIGRGGADMYKALAVLFKTLKRALDTNPGLFNKLRFYFIGTSYAPTGQGIPSVLPIAQEYGVQNSVIEITDRISYYHTLLTLQQADALFIPGSDDPNYTASKIYPYLLTQKPLLAIFNSQSSVVSILNQCTLYVTVLSISGEDGATDNKLYALLTGWADGDFQNIQLTNEFDNYSARCLALQQVAMFNQVIQNSEDKNTFN
nr:glycosyltransferase [Mucilaginibacter sp. L294]